MGTILELTELYFIPFTCAFHPKKILQNLILKIINFLHARLKYISPRVMSRVKDEFSELVDSNSQSFIPRFTWSNAENSRLRSRLDRFLVSTAWEELNLEMIQIFQLTLVSDNLPSMSMIMLDCSW